MKDNGANAPDRHLQVLRTEHTRSHQDEKQQQQQPKTSPQTMHPSKLKSLCIKLIKSQYYTDWGKTESIFP